jgi:hypothetical protein
MHSDGNVNVCDDSVQSCENIFSTSVVDFLYYRPLLQRFAKKNHLSNSLSKMTTVGWRHGFFSR